MKISFSSVCHLIPVCFLVVAGSLQAQFVFGTDNATNSPYVYGQDYNGLSGATSVALGDWISSGVTRITNSPAGSSSFGVMATTNSGDVSTAARQVASDTDYYLSYQFGYNGINSSGGEYRLILGTIGADTYNLFYNPSSSGSHWLFNDGTGNVDTGVTATSGALLTYNFTRISATEYTVSLSGSGSWSRTATLQGASDLFSIQATQSGAGNVIGVNSMVVGSVPEPSTWALFGFGGLVLLAFSLRRKKI